MFRVLRYGLLGLIFALPFAVPQASQAAAPAGIVRCRTVYVRPYCSWYRPIWFGHRHFRR
jgi:hypothetical protein